jgi:hypothetical protein
MRKTDRLQITAYFAFTASIVLYIYVIQQRASPPETYSEYLSAATRCQSHILAIAEKGSLSERYSLVLEELRLEVLRQTDRTHVSMANLGGTSSHPHVHDLQTTSISMDGDAMTAVNYTDLMGDPAIDFNDMSGSVSDYSGWGQFASMVSSGLGNLDAFLNDDPFRL